MKVTIDRDKCSGCGLCESTAPDVFKLGKDGVATVLVDVVPANLEKDVQMAADDCPESAIIIS